MKPNSSNTVDLEKAAELLNEAFMLVGLSCESEDMKDTPMRVAKWLRDIGEKQDCFPQLTESTNYDPHSEIKATMFDANGCDELIIENNIEYSSVCAHHLLPFYGTATIGYLPDKKIIGASKIPRILDFFAGQPQTQEYLTNRVCEYLHQQMCARFTGVILRGTHTCCACRGAKKPGMIMVTSCFRPSSNASLKSEFIELSKL